MQRRNLIKLGAAALASLTLPKEERAQNAMANAARGLSTPKIRDISVIETQPAGVRLTVVKITTDQDGLYGYGCATFTQRADLVKAAVEKYLKPLLLGKTTDRIEDIWQMCYDSSYWKNGPVLNNAISGIDEALWDIKGRQLGVPVYQLVGGKCREAAECFASAGGNAETIVGRIKELKAQGFRKVRIGGGMRGGAEGGGPSNPSSSIKVLHDRPVLDRETYVSSTLKLFEDVSRDLPEGMKLATDVHSKLAGNMALRFCKDCEKFPIFFLEDPLAPEDLAWYREIRRQCVTPIAMGELFNSPHEWQPLIQDRLIDYIRVHVSQAGGFTPSRKIALMGEFYGVMTAWHAPGDLSPVGQMANATLDVISYNFGIQEWGPTNPRVQEIFQGCAEMKDGYIWVSEKPGWGVEVNEKIAAKYPFTDSTNGLRKGLNGGWTDLRLPDGTVIKQ